MITKTKEVLVNERVFEGLMRGEIRPERTWWGVYPNQYKIMSDGTIVYKQNTE